MDGNECLIIASTEGELKGFNQIPKESVGTGDGFEDYGGMVSAGGGGGGYSGSRNLTDSNPEQEALRELTQRRQVKYI